MSEPQKSTAKKLPVAYKLTSGSRCYNCDLKREAGSIVTLKREEDEKEVLCAKCSQLETLEFLPGNKAKLTQVARNNSVRKFVVMQWSQLWKCYERQGLLLEPSAIDKAQETLGINNAPRKKTLT